MHAGHEKKQFILARLVLPIYAAHGATRHNQTNMETTELIFISVAAEPGVHAAGAPGEAGPSQEEPQEEHVPHFDHVLSRDVSSDSCRTLGNRFLSGADGSGLAEQKLLSELGPLLPPELPELIMTASQKGVGNVPQSSTGGLEAPGGQSAHGVGCGFNPQGITRF